MRSFRLRLALRYTAMMGAGVITISTVSLLTLRSTLDRDLNASILNVASIQAASLTDPPSGEMHFHEWELTPEEAASVHELNRYAQVWSGDGVSLLRTQYITEDLPLDSSALARAMAGKLVWTEATFEGFPIRSLYYPLGRLGPLHERHVLQVGAPLSGRNAMLARLEVFFAGIALLVVIGTFVGSWRLAVSALRPVNEIIDQAEEIEAGSLQRGISAYADSREYQHLVDVLNSMLVRLRSAFESQRRFTADASHELRSPLTAMWGELELALRREREPEEYRRVLASALEEVVRLSRISDDMLTLARSDAGAITLRRERVNLADAAARTVERLHRRTDADAVHIVLHTEGDTTGVFDRDLAGQVIWNLIDNAVKFSESGDTVEVHLRGEESAILITVTDSGPGLGDGPPQRVFERFFQGDESRTNAGDVTGTGLGLPIVKAIVEAHGGQVEAANREEGGARFTVRLPREDLKARRGEASSDVEPASMTTSRLPK